MNKPSVIWSFFSQLIGIGVTIFGVVIAAWESFIYILMNNVPGWPVMENLLFLLLGFSIAMSGMWLTVQSSQRRQLVEEG